MTLYLYYWTLASFSAVIISSSVWFYMPEWPWIIPCLAIVALSLKVNKLRVFLGSLAACVVVLTHSNLLRHQTDTLFQAGSNLTINAEVDSFFKQISHGFQGRAVVRSINGQTLNIYERPTVWLKAPVSLNIGQTITAKVDIKPIIGQMNEVGFDAEKYAYSQSIAGRVVVDKKASFFVENHWSLRYAIYQAVSDQVDTLSNGGLIKALVFGVRQGIPDEVSTQLRDSGLSHLVAISGLHIGIMFGVGWLVGTLLLRLSFHFTLAPVITGLVTASLYAWLAGFSIPTSRALMMCLFLCLFQSMQIKTSLLFKWLLVLSILLSIWPRSAVDMSLWMSMAAVAIILLFLSLNRNRTSYWKTVIGLQLFISLLMSPVIGLLFDGFSLGSLIYNLVFVPWFSFVVIPLTFLSLLMTVLPVDSELLWHWTDLSLSVVIYAMQFASHAWVDLSSLQVKFLYLAIGASGLYFVLSNFGRIVLVIVASALTINWKPTTEWKLVVLDVGHGLALVIIQDSKALVYDTGTAWEKSSYAEQVITPYLVRTGVSVVDYFIVSHFDNDHAGGWKSIIDRWKPQHFITSQFGHSDDVCVKGKIWQWHDLTLEALWPQRIVTRAYNPHSCVIKVTHKLTNQSVLIPGDVEAVAEWMLVREPEKLNSTVVIVPHHGSKTSSLPAFVKATNLELAIASTAYKGRWNLPSSDVVKRYLRQGAVWLDTGTSGQTSINFYTDGYQVEQLRQGKRQAWYRQMMRKGVE